MLEKIAQHLAVKYIYSESASLETTQSIKLAVASFQVMPTAWIAQLNYAARSANERQIFELLEDIPKEYSDLKTAVIQLVHNFQLHQLIRLTEVNSS